MRECVIPLDRDKEYYFHEGCFIIEQLQQPDDSELSVARARVTQGVTTRWHKLLNITERYYILNGCGQVELGDGIKQLVNEGDVVVIPAGCRQRITNCGEVDLIFLALCTPPFHVDAYLALD